MSWKLREVSEHATWRNHVALFFDACVTSRQGVHHWYFLQKLFKIASFWNFSRSIENEKVHVVKSMRFQRERVLRTIFLFGAECFVLSHGVRNFQGRAIRIQKILSTGVCTQRVLTHSASVSAIRALNAFFQQSIAASIFHVLNHHCSPKLKFKKKIKICVM